MLPHVTLKEENFDPPCKPYTELSPYHGVLLVTLTLLWELFRVEVTLFPLEFQWRIFSFGLILIILFTFLPLVLLIPGKMVEVAEDLLKGGWIDVYVINYG